VRVLREPGPTTRALSYTFSQTKIPITATQISVATIKMSPRTLSSLLGAPHCGHLRVSLLIFAPHS